MLSDYLTQEFTINERIIYQNESFVVLIPFWAICPFETMITPKKYYNNIMEISKQESLAFADAIAKITEDYDKLFQTSFSHSCGIHQAPTANNKQNDH